VTVVAKSFKDCVVRKAVSNWRIQTAIRQRKGRQHTICKVDLGIGHIAGQVVTKLALADDIVRERRSTTPGIEVDSTRIIQVIL
jgi:hypothetical protein